MADIINFNGYTTLDIDPDQILEEAKGKYKQIIVIGVEKDSGYDKVHVSSSTSDAKDLLWMMEIGKNTIFEVMFVEEE